jgi:transcriptional regulator with XRE-family HTH domain
VAKRLRQAREELGLSQRELGVRAGLDPSVASPRINQYEQNKHAPNVAVLGQLAAVLGRPLAYFYAAEDDLAELITAFHRSSARERQKLMASIRG